MFRAAPRRLIERVLRRCPGLSPREVASGWVEVERMGLQWRLCVDRYVDGEVYRHGSFERKTTQRVRELVRPGMRILDVGANFGYFTTVFADLVGPEGRVWAFEPTQRYRPRIDWHLAANGLSDRVKVLDYGLSDREATLEIAIGESSATIHPPVVEGYEGRETIRLRRLDDVAGELGIDRVDLVKIDIDGHEPMMLRGAEKTLRKHRPTLVIEFSQANLDVAGHDARTLREQLLALGYELHSERTGQPFASRRAFLMECANFTHSANVWAHPVREAAALAQAA